MRVKIWPYRNRRTCQIHYDYMNKKYDYRWDENQTRFESFLEKVEDGLQWVYNHTINLYLDKLSSQKIKVRIDKYDTWSMDNTLAPIILPMLKQLRATKHGSPMVDMKDVPKELRATKKHHADSQETGDVDPYFFDRWDWVMGEMIWAFEQKCRDNWQDDFYGDYTEDPKNGAMVGSFEWIDHDGMKAHQTRMTNGFKLFGKYYENLWD